MNYIQRLKREKREILEPSNSRMLSLPWCASRWKCHESSGIRWDVLLGGWAPGLDETLEPQVVKVPLSEILVPLRCWSSSCCLLRSQPSLWFLPKLLDGGGRTLQRRGEFSTLFLPHSDLPGSQEGFRVWTRLLSFFLSELEDEGWWGTCPGCPLVACTFLLSQDITVLRRCSLVTCLFLRIC